MSNVAHRVTFFIRQTYFRKPASSVYILTRSFADVPKKDSPSDVVVRDTKSDEHIRVRRARPADVPRVLTFIREHTRDVWPSLTAPSSASHIVLSDYVSRALAQGHSMIAEHQEAKRNVSRIRALALGTTMCKWDAAALEKWARCVQCSRSRQLLMFTAHCLRAPALHDKYQVHNILQVIMIVPEDVSQRKEVIQMLAKSAMQRGRDIGFSVLRFDAANNAVIQVLEDMHFNKEWQIVYDVLPDAIKERQDSSVVSGDGKNKTRFEIPRVGQKRRGHSLTVFSAFTDTPK
ncbi:uncharacterized protein [Battus philenor]|uniref:uncharacterized protein n=1 Tax=Battus philenor TaxID=42288 RepID=UPI0035CF0F4F